MRLVVTSDVITLDSGDLTPALKRRQAQWDVCPLTTWGGPDFDPDCRQSRPSDAAQNYAMVRAFEVGKVIPIFALELDISRVVLGDEKLLAMKMVMWN